MRISAMDPVRPGRSSSEPLERISLLVPESTKDRLVEIADSQGVSLCAVIRAALNRVFKPSNVNRVGETACIAKEGSKSHCPP
jgi:hypothetical protein